MIGARPQSRQTTGAKLTREQKHQLLDLGLRKGMLFVKACRVIGLHHNRVKGMIEREGCPFLYDQMMGAFPGAFDQRNEREPEDGPRKVRYQDLGPLPVPDTLHASAARQAWRPGLEVRCGA